MLRSHCIHRSVKLQLWILWENSKIQEVNDGVNQAETVKAKLAPEEKF